MTGWCPLPCRWTAGSASRAVTTARSGCGLWGPVDACEPLWDMLAQQDPSQSRRMPASACRVVLMGRSGCGHCFGISTALIQPTGTTQPGRISGTSCCFTALTGPSPAWASQSGRTRISRSCSKTSRTAATAGCGPKVCDANWRRWPRIGRARRHFRESRTE